jgi:formimidoylglutamate deiminase
MNFFAQSAWVNGQWSRDVRLTAGKNGLWTAIAANQTCQPGDTRVGVVLPGLTNAHSHAFQRAMAGLSEQGSQAGDNFWRWRQAMYQVALNISPAQLETVATWLYAELLSQGYTHLCEFHYIHCDPKGNPYADGAEMSWALVRAAQQVGIGLTLLPTLYQHRGFDRQGLQTDQRRFAGTPESILAIRDQIQHFAAQEKRPHLLHAGVAIHSLRAVAQAELEALVEASGQHPIHIHVSEQQKEVEDCVAHTGLRPIEWLCEHIGLDHRWNLVHATHTISTELEQAAQAQAAVVICPITEANLGDGIFDLITAIDTKLHCSIGTDSHTNRDWSAELRSLEYSLRLTQQVRNVASREATGYRPTGQALFEMALRGSSSAAGLPLGGIKVGERADFFELDPQANPLAGLTEESFIDALVFSTPSNKPKSVYVAGEIKTTDMPRVTALAVKTMHGLWQGT